MNRTALVLCSLYALILLTGCMDTNGEARDCLAALPAEKVIAPDSLLLTPFSRCIYKLKADSSSLDCRDNFTLQASPKDTTNVLAHFTLNNFTLKIDGVQRYIPVPTFGAGTSWKCPDHIVTQQVELYRSDLSSTYRIALNKGSEVAKEWTLTYHFDSARTPDIVLDSVAGGLKISIQPKPGTAMRSAYCFLEGDPSKEIVSQPFTQGVSSTLLFKNYNTLNFPVDSLNLRNERLFVCAEADSTLQTITVNGQILPSRATYCKSVEGPLNEAIYAYRRKYCTDCK